MGKEGIRRQIKEQKCKDKFNGDGRRRRRRKRRKKSRNDERGGDNREKEENGKGRY